MIDSYYLPGLLQLFFCQCLFIVWCCSFYVLQGCIAQSGICLTVDQVVFKFDPCLVPCSHGD